MTVEPRPEPRIVPARVEHLEQIAAFADRLWRAYFPGIISLEQIEHMLARQYALEVLSQEIVSGGVSYDRMLLGSDLIGFASYGPAQSPDEMKLHKLYVACELHGKGYGSRLLAHVESTARRCGYKTLVLSVNKRNHQAIALYRRRGFTVREAVVADIGSGFVMDDYVMVKELGEQA